MYKFITNFVDIVETLLSKFERKILLFTKSFDKLNYMEEQSKVNLVTCY